LSRRLSVDIDFKVIYDEVSNVAFGPQRLNQVHRSPHPMSMTDSDWYAALARPSRTASTVLLGLGLWIILLSLVNIIDGAFYGEKVLWFEFLTNGSFDDISAPHNGIEITSDDLLFGLVGVAFSGVGIMGLRSAGVQLAQISSSLSGLFSSELGIRKTIADWMIVVGIIFYMAWSVQEGTWVDPGVFAVSVVPFAFGIGLNLLDSAEA